MKMDHKNTCPVCGKRKGGKNPFDHTECSKVLKATGTHKEKPRRAFTKASGKYLSNF